MAVASRASPRPRSPGWLAVDPQHAAAVVRVVATARVLFVALGLLALLMAPSEATAFFPGLIAGLALTLGLAVAVLGASHVFPLVVARYAPLLHAWDVAWVVILVALTDGAHSHFLGYVAYVLLASAFQWRVAATVATGAVVLLIIPIELLVHEHWQLHATVELAGLLLPVASLALGVVLVLWLAEKEWSQRLRSITVARIVGGVTAEAGFVAGVRLVIGELLEQSGAERAVLAVEEIGGAQVFLWRMERQPGGASLRLTERPRSECATYMFAVPPEIAALRLRRRRDGHVRLLVLERHGTFTSSPTPLAQPLLDTPFGWTTALCVTDTIGAAWGVRLFIFDPGRRRSGRGHLRFLRAVLSQVAPALFNVYLLRRMQSRSGGAQRAAVVRAMHDGELQSLIAAGLELELVRREAGHELSDPTRLRLARVQELLNAQVLEVRDVIQALKQVDVAPDRFLDHVADLVRRFRDSTGIAASIDCGVDDVTLPPRTCRELADVVREALVNVRKHAHASAVNVRFSNGGHAWRLDISDNGKGFDFDGRLGDEELRAQSRGPQIIRERVTDIGGRLFVESHPGRGSTLEITIPARLQ